MKKKHAFIVLIILSLLPIGITYYTQNNLHYIGYSASVFIAIYNSTYYESASGYVMAKIPAQLITYTPPTVSIPSPLISTPGLNTPEAIFSMLLFLGIFVILSKNYNMFISLAIASAIMMLFWMIVFRDITYSLFFLVLFAIGVALARKYGS